MKEDLEINRANEEIMINEGGEGRQGGWPIFLLSNISLLEY